MAIKKKIKRKFRVEWHEGGLEISTGRTIYIFYRVHLIRIFSVVLILLGAIWMAYYLTQRDTVHVVWKTGNLFVYHADSDQWVKTSETRLNKPTAFRSGDKPAESFQTISEERLREQLDLLSSERSVIRYNSAETILLSTGATVFRKADDHQVDFTLNGVVYLTLKPREKNQATEYLVNGVRLTVDDCTLMYQDLLIPAEILAMSGNCSIPARQEKFMHLNDDLKPEGGFFRLTEGTVLAITDDLILIEKQRDDREAIRKSSFLPGFDKAGHYQAVGKAIISSGTYELVRNDKRYQVKEYRIPVMAGDRVINTTFVPVLIELDSGDKFRIYPQSSITIPEPDRKSGKALPLLLLRNDAIAEELSPVYQIEGRVRTLIAPRNKQKGIRLRTATALIAVKGTDFEMNGSDQATEVLVVTGVVELGSQQPPVVSISRGFMSKVEKGYAPAAPYPIPPERFKELLTDSFDTKDKPQLQSEGLLLDQMTIGQGETLSFTWSKPLKAGNIVINGISYPLRSTDNPDQLALDRSTLKGVITGKYPFRLEAMDTSENWGEASGYLSVLPEKSLNFLCDQSKVTFSAEEREAIRSFQREATIKVDGIVGPETRAMIAKILNCSG